MKNKLAIAAVLTVGALIGDAFAVTRANRRIRQIHSRQTKELKESQQLAFNAGWEYAVSSPSTVRAAHKRMFGIITEYSSN